MKHITFKKKSCFTQWKSLIALFIVMGLVISIFRPIKLLQIKTVEAQEIKQEVEIKQEQLKKIEEENTILQIKAIEVKTVSLTENQIKKILSILMPKESDRSRFMAILACENGNHDPKRIHINKEGLGYDLGIIQANSVFHSKEVKEIFNKDFDEAMADPVYSLVYAVKLYKDRGEKFDAWVCNRIVA